MNVRLWAVRRGYPTAYDELVGPRFDLGSLILSVGIAGCIPGKLLLNDRFSDGGCGY
jgi:hypothetical protein